MVPRLTYVKYIIPNRSTSGYGAFMAYEANDRLRLCRVNLFIDSGVNAVLGTPGGHHD